MYVTLARTDTTPVQLATLLHSPHDFVVLKRGPGSRLLRRLASSTRLLLGALVLKSEKLQCVRARTFQSQPWHVKTHTSADLSAVKTLPKIVRPSKEHLFKIALHLDHAVELEVTDWAGESDLTVTLSKDSSRRPTLTFVVLAAAFDAVIGGRGTDLKPRFAAALAG